MKCDIVVSGSLSSVTDKNCVRYALAHIAVFPLSESDDGSVLLAATDASALAMMTATGKVEVPEGKNCILIPAEVFNDIQAGTDTQITLIDDGKVWKVQPISRLGEKKLKKAKGKVKFYEALPVEEYSRFPRLANMVPRDLDQAAYVTIDVKKLMALANAIKTTRIATKDSQNITLRFNITQDRFGRTTTEDPITVLANEYTTDSVGILMPCFFASKEVPLNFDQQAKHMASLADSAG